MLYPRGATCMMLRSASKQEGVPRTCLQPWAPLLECMAGAVLLRQILVCCTLTRMLYTTGGWRRAAGGGRQPERLRGRRQLHGPVRAAAGSSGSLPAKVPPGSLLLPGCTATTVDRGSAQLLPCQPVVVACIGFRNATSALPTATSQHWLNSCAAATCRDAADHSVVAVSGRKNQLCMVPGVAGPQAAAAPPR